MLIILTFIRSPVLFGCQCFLKYICVLENKDRRMSKSRQNCNFRWTTPLRITNQVSVSWLNWVMLPLYLVYSWIFKRILFFMSHTGCSMVEYESSLKFNKYDMLPEWNVNENTCGEQLQAMRERKDLLFRKWGRHIWKEKIEINHLNAINLNCFNTIINVLADRRS